MQYTKPSIHQSLNIHAFSVYLIYRYIVTYHPGVLAPSCFKHVTGEK